MFTRALRMVAFALAAAVPATAQQEESRQQMQERLRQLQQEVRELQRRLNEESRREVRGSVTARAQQRPLIRLSSNRAMLGVTVRTEKSPRVDSIGAELMAVTPGAPADRAGLRSGDVITVFNSEQLAGRYPAAGEYQSEPGLKLVHLARELDDGDTVEVDYRRDRDTGKATIVARRMEPDEWFSFDVEPPDVRIDADRVRDMARGFVGPNFAFSFSQRWLDMELVSLSADLGEYFGTTEGLLVVRAPDQGSLNLKSGDVIHKIGGRTPTSQASAVRILRSYGDGESVEFEIMRLKRKMTVTGTMPDRDRDHEPDLFDGGFEFRR